VDETGSNWDKEIWDSKAIGPDATSSRLGQSSALPERFRGVERVVEMQAAREAEVVEIGEFGLRGP
jgi:hypothetical protein